MRKLGILALALMLLMGMSFGVMADDNGGCGDCPEVYSEDSTPVTLRVCPYAEINFFTNENYNGLFSAPLEGMAGLYVSDGNATKNAANLIWSYSDDPGADLAIAGSGVYTQGDPNSNLVSPFTVDMNTPVNIDMTVDWTGWAPVPTLFRISSSTKLSYSDGGGNGFGAWGDNLAMVTNVATELGGVNVLNFVQEDSFTSAASDWKTVSNFNGFNEDNVCEGPYELHLNGAVYLPKIGSLLADKDYIANITLTVSAAPQDVLE